MTRAGSVLVVTGCGGMGVAVVRRLGSGRAVLLADVDTSGLASAAAVLRSEGFRVTEYPADVSDKESVVGLASAASELGAPLHLVHTAGVSPALSDVERILRVDLVGAAYLLDAFGEVVSPGAAGVFIASMAGTLMSLDKDLERTLAQTPADELLDLPFLESLDDAGAAYGVAKRANQLRVRAAATAWGRMGARVNSVSPGIISTKMGQAELASPIGEIMQQMIAESAMSRIGTAADIAAATEFLLSDQASFITGTDLLVDGGVCATVLA